MWGDVGRCGETWGDAWSGSLLPERERIERRSFAYQSEFWKASSAAAMPCTAVPSREVLMKVNMWFKPRLGVPISQPFAPSNSSWQVGEPWGGGGGWGGERGGDEGEMGGDEGRSGGSRRDIWGDVGGGGEPWQPILSSMRDVPRLFSSPVLRRLGTRKREMPAVPALRVRKHEGGSTVVCSVRALREDEG